MAGHKQTIYIRIRDLRRQHSLTQEGLAEALGISRQSINAMEAGRCLPSLPVVLQVASFFGVPITTLFDQPKEIGKEHSMANLVPWSPLREMRETLDELMDETVNWTTSGAQISGPAVNVLQTKEEVVVEARLPGYHKDNISIEVGEDFLSISGETKQEEESTDKQYFRREFALQSFNRTISLSALVQAEKAEAEMKHGLLRVRIPKIIEEKPKTTRVAIKTEE